MRVLVCGGRDYPDSSAIWGALDTLRREHDGSLHIEQMSDNCYWGRLELSDGKAIVMWFSSRGKIKLAAEWD